MWMDPPDPDGIIYHVGTSSGHDSAFLLHCIHKLLNKDINNPFQFEGLKILSILSFVFWANGKVQCVCVCVEVLVVWQTSLGVIYITVTGWGQTSGPVEE